MNCYKKCTSRPNPHVMENHHCHQSVRVMENHHYITFCTFVQMYVSRLYVCTSIRFTYACLYVYMSVRHLSEPCPNPIRTLSEPYPNPNPIRTLSEPYPNPIRTVSERECEGPNANSKKCRSFPFVSHIKTQIIKKAVISPSFRI